MRSPRDRSRTAAAMGPAAIWMGKRVADWLRLDSDAKTRDYLETAIVMGLALNWSWLAAAGVAPILISLLPCLAMCALGLCMNRAGSQSCSTVAKTSNRAAVDDTEPVTEAAAFEAPPESAAPELPISGEAAPPASPEPQTPKERTPTDA